MPGPYSTTDALEVTLDDSVAVLEMRKPPANYFDEELVRAIATATHALDHEPRCRALVLCAAGRHFCAGADFADTEGFGADKSMTARRIYEQAARLFETRKPIIAAVQGAAVGGGLGLACAADFRVADSDARFVANFSRLGIHQGFGLSATLPNIVGKQTAADLLMRGATIRGDEALRVGLVDRLAGSGEQRAVAVAWARELAEAAPLAVSSIRSTLRAGLAEQVRAALDHELAEQSRLWRTQDSAEGIAASLERRKPTFTGS